MLEGHGTLTSVLSAMIKYITLSPLSYSLLDICSLSIIAVSEDLALDVLTPHIDVMLLLASFTQLEAVVLHHPVFASILVTVLLPHVLSTY